MISTQQTIVPAVVLSTTSDTVSSSCHAHKADAASTTCVDKDYHVCGNLQTHKYDCVQECQLNDDKFDACGDSHATITTCGDDDEHCGCGHSAKEEEEERECKDPDEDISMRITKQVEDTIGDVLSEVINRCIQSSLHSCIKFN